MNTSFLIFFGIYLVAMVVIAIRSMRKTNSVESFSVASKDIGPGVAAITFAATFMSASTFMGLPGQMYNVGVSGLWFHMFQWFPCILTLAIMAKAYRRQTDLSGSLSLPDFLGERYNSTFMRIWVSIVTLLFIVQIGSQLVGVGTVMEQMMGIKYEWGVIIGICVLLFYLTFGGTYAHIYTNVVQGSLMVFAAIVIFGSGFVLFGNIFTEVPARLAEVDPKYLDTFASNDPQYGSAVAVAGIFVAHACWTCNPQLMNKIQYLKSEKDIRKFILLSGLFICLGATVLATGLYARIIITEPLASIDQAVPVYVNTVFPKVVAAFLNVVILAAVMSTTDGIMVYLSTMLGNTLYRETYIKGKIERGEAVDMDKANKTALRICQWGVVVVGICGVPIAFARPASLSTLLWIGNGGILAAVVGPILMGLFSKKASKRAAILSSVLGVAIYFILFFGGFIQSAYLCTGVGGIISFLLCWLFSQIWPDTTGLSEKAVKASHTREEELAAM